MARKRTFVRPTILIHHYERHIRDVTRKWPVLVVAAEGSTYCRMVRPIAVDLLGDQSRSLPVQHGYTIGLLPQGDFLDCAFQRYARATSTPPVVHWLEMHRVYYPEIGLVDEDRSSERSR